MKKLLTTILLLIIPTLVFAAAPDLIIGSGTGSQGQSITIPVTADFSSPMIDLQFDLQYDPAILTPVSISLGSATTNWSLFSNTSKSGVINIGMFNTAGITGSTQQVALINFTVNAVPGTATIASPNLFVSNVLFQTTPVTALTNGNFTLNLMGDINGDGKVTINDAGLIAQASVGLITLTPLQISSGDVNGDGKITMYDAALIAEYATGIINKFH